MKVRKLVILTLLAALLLSLFAGALATETEDGLPPEPVEDGVPDVPLSFITEAEGDLDAAPSAPYEPVWENFTDTAGHWAEDTIKKGFSNGLIQGFPDYTIRPDDAITAAQMITILTRVLGATQTADISAWGISADTWYYEAAGKAVFLGLIDSGTGSLDAAMTRQDAFAMMAKAFALTPANPDLTVLNAFSDSGLLKDLNKAHIAALVSEGLVQGFDGALNVGGNIKRAEFLTVLYRVAENYVTAQGLNSSLSGGTVVSGSAAASYKTLGKLWFDCTASSVSLSGITAESVTLRSHALSSLSIGGSSKLGTLVIDCGAADINLGALNGVTLETIRLQGGGSLTITDSVVKNIEITGDNQTVTIGGKHDSLIISGSVNKVTLLKNASVGHIMVIGSDNTLTGEYVMDTPQPVTVTGTIDVLGSRNHIDFTGDFGNSIFESGEWNSVFLRSENTISKITAAGNNGIIVIGCISIGEFDISGSYKRVYENTTLDYLLNPGELKTINRLSVSGTGNNLTLSSTSHCKNMSITGRENVLELAGLVDRMTIDGYKTTITGYYDGSGSIENLTLNAAGCTISISVANLTDNSRDYDADRVLALVTSAYKGNFTLAWAESHDYEDFEKEIWVNAKGYSSKTEYLIWVNLAMQRTNIFIGSQGNWTLIRSCIIGSGAPRTGTPVGVYYTTYKLAAGWTTSTYTCRPVVGFKENSGYAFHSRLYYPNSNRLTDASIGYPVSHGCIRMYDEDINYIYNSIPLGTTVVVY